MLTGNQTLSLETNESYTLQVSAPTVKLTAVTVYGALRGLETFAQLVTPSYAGSTNELRAARDYVTHERTYLWHLRAQTA